LHALGVRSVPIVAKGKDYVVAKNLDTVADFVDVPRPSHIPLPPEELFHKWMKILRAAQRYIRQIPNDQMNLSATHNRRRIIRSLGHHIFSIGGAHVESVVNGAKDMTALCSPPIADGTFTTGEEIARYGDEVIARIEQWWNGLADKSCRQEIEIIYGGIPMRYSVHKQLERCVWHSTHHTRQLADVLERRGIEPDGTLSKTDLDGLPLPKRIWE
jgi:hypothetical protein